MGAFTKKPGATTPKITQAKPAAMVSEASSAVPSAFAKFGAKTVDLNGQLPEHFVVTVFGLTGVGKDSFCLTLPRPTLWIETEPDGILRARKTLDSEGVYRVPAYMPPDSGVGKEVMDAKWKAHCEATLTNLQGAFDAACKDDGIRTIVLNTETDIWNLVRGAEFGRLFQVMQIMYSHVNPVMEAFFVKARAAKKNLVLVQKGEPAWEVERNAKGEPVLDKNGRQQRVQTEEIEGKGWKNTHFNSDIIIGMDKERPKKLGSKVAAKFILQAVKCGFGSGVEGRVFEGEECSWDSVVAAIRGEI